MEMQTVPHGSACRRLTIPFDALANEPTDEADSSPDAGPKSRDNAPPQAAPEQMRDHLIVCGVGHVGYRVAELLRQIGEPFVILSRQVPAEWADIMREGSTPYIIGDARAESCLREAGIATAKGILIVTGDDLVNIQIAADAQRINPDISLIVRVFDHDLAERIGREMGVRDVLSPALLTAPVFTAAALGEEMLRAFTISGCGVDVLRLTFGEQTPGLGEMRDEFCARRDLIPLAARHATHSLEHHAQGANALHKAAESAAGFAAQSVSGIAAAGVDIHLERPLAPGDEIVVLASGAATERLRRGGYLPAPLLPAQGRLRSARDLLGNPSQAAQNVARTWRRTPQFLRLTFAALLTMLLSSVVVFHYAMHIPWIDSFYFVISIITTVGFGDYNLRYSSPALKVFGCFVMLAGAALVAIVFGIITDYIVTARVNQALGRRQSHLSNHLVVVGLGDVGTRVVEALQRLKQPIIAIERDINNENAVALADELYVVIGDANRASVLEQANVAQARAIIVTTPDDLDNLRIAHQAERLNPDIRSVVRIYDSILASRIVSSLGIDRAVNAAATAAATFVACTIDRHTEHGFTLGERLFLLRWMLPEEASRAGLVRATIQEARDQGLAPILKRAGTGLLERTAPVVNSDLIATGDSLLVLEEYDTETRAAEPPNVQMYADSSTL